MSAIPANLLNIQAIFSRPFTFLSNTSNLCEGGARFLMVIIFH